jgi:hypothetical protein
MSMQTTGTVKAFDPQAIEKQKRITIIVTENPKQVMVIPDMVRLNKFEKHSATWECPQGLPFEISFGAGESPFEREGYDHTDAKDLVPRGDAENNRHRPYKYTVTVPGYPALDPGVIVEP